MNRIYCATCNRYNALPDGPKTPTGKALCNSCHDKLMAHIKQSKANKASTAAKTKGV